MRWMSKGPTAGTADTETQVGAADFTFPSDKDWTVKKIKVSFGHVANAKSACGILELKVDTIKGPFKYVVGAGAGGAATTMIHPAEIIETNLPLNKGAKVGAYVTFADTAADVQISLGYVPGKSGAIRYSDAPALDAAQVADTRSTLGSITIRSDLARVRLISCRVGIGAVVDAKASSSLIEIAGIPDIASDQMTFTVFGAAPGATNSGNASAEETELDITVPGNTTLTVYGTTAEATVESGFSISYEPA